LGDKSLGGTRARVLARVLGFPCLPFPSLQESNAISNCSIVWHGL
jgi:hypothetical protein